MKNEIWKNDNIIYRLHSKIYSWLTNQWYYSGSESLRIPNDDSNVLFDRHSKVKKKGFDTQISP